MSSATPVVVPTKGLGPGFVQVTIVMTIINVAFALAALYMPLDFLLPSEANPASDSAVSIDALFKFMTVFGVAITIYVTGYTMYFAWVFRRRDDEPINTVGIPIHDAPKLELWWTVLPTILLVVLMAFTIVVWKQIQFPTGAANLTMEVVAHQFNWEFRYPGMQGSLYSSAGAEMHLPYGKQVKILVASGDVIHQFWVPEFRLKIAAVPGMVTQLNLTPIASRPRSTFRVRSIAAPTTARCRPSSWSSRRSSSTRGWPPRASRPPRRGRRLRSTRASPTRAKRPSRRSARRVITPPARSTRRSSDRACCTSPTTRSIPNSSTARTRRRPTSRTSSSRATPAPIGAMPNRQANGLSDADIANLVAYLVSLK